ncbi:FAD/NAD(P)-binding domain-containing protein [Aureobasidium pullulans]|uniref:FAD/NAD(P)-binding domain-containing protein n=1 Tax=Aureobasidium pullulans TaxID=5580 RepID=A0A4S9ECP4_AURPU|nr:FAD/NAD(P)-binding domain-containing protein [Aureobasidium pullulans]
MSRLLSLSFFVLGALAQGTSPSYDYIIAGAGPAGIIVAERLAEAGVSVLLLERGNASTYASGGRSLVPWNNTLTQYDVPGVRHYIKNSFADKSEYCTDTPGNAGCILGGGTMVNQLAYIPPQNVDFDDKWPVGWKWTDVASAAERVHSLNPGSTNPSADGVHYDQTSYNAFANFFSAQGYTSVDAISEPNSKHDVYSHAPYNVKNGLVAGPVMTYLPMAQAMSNFKLQLHTKVIRAVRNGSTVTGVEVEVDGQRQIISLNNGGRVILASGVFSTPRILFNSGIGPNEQLQIVAGSKATTNVTLPASSDWINLPVGQGIKDHIIVTLNFNTTESVDFLDTSYFIKPSSNITDPYSHGNGILTQGYQRFTFWTSNTTSDGSVRYFQGTCYASGQNYVSMKLYLTHGLTSSGALGITAAGNTVYTVDPYLNTAEDKYAIASFIDNLLVQTRKADSTLIYSGPSTDTGASLSKVYTGGSHWVATAKMGTDDGRVNNGTSVVDLNLKVYGTDNLFVVDASMHPDLPTGNLQATVQVAAEAAAVKILALPKQQSLSSSSSSSSSATSSISTSSSSTSQLSSVSTTSSTSTQLSSSASSTLVTPTTSASTSSTSSSTSSTSSTNTAQPTNPTCPKSDGTTFTAKSGAVFLVECYVDRVGHDIAYVDVPTNRIADCVNKCDALPGCVDISMSGTACYMKGAVGEKIVNSKYIRGARRIS